MSSQPPTRSAIAELRDRDLVRLHWQVELRPAFDALFAIDDAMADVVAGSTQPALGAIKLAWWRERLIDLDQGKVPAEPRLQAAWTQLLPRGVSGEELSDLEAGWAALLDQSPDMASVADRGTRLFELAARLLRVEFRDETLRVAGRMFAGASAARRGFFGVPALGGSGRTKSPRRARPLTALAALAARDLRRGGPPFEPEGTPGRAFTILKHRVTGRL